MSDPSIVFMGTPDLAAVCLKALLDAPGLHVIAAVTQPDRPKGRELRLQPSPVKELALAHSIPVLQPNRARNEDFLQQLRGLGPDLVAVAAFGQILPKTVLELPRFGCLNVHTSLLPRYRGAAPIQWAILNDDVQTGVTIMKMDAGLDTGDILTQEVTEIRPEDTSVTLHDRLAQIGARLLVTTIHDYVAGRIHPRPQPLEGMIYAPKIKKDDGRIDWSQSARSIWNRVRGLTPWPGAFTSLPGDPHSTPPVHLKIWEAQPQPGNAAPGEIVRTDHSGLLVGCGQGTLNITLLQRESGRRLGIREFLAGHPLHPGTYLGSI